MGRLGRHMMRYKFNYAIKGFAAYLVYRDIAQRRHMKKTTYVTVQQESMMMGSTFLHGGIFLGLCAII